MYFFVDFFPFFEISAQAVLFLTIFIDLDGVMIEISKNHSLPKGRIWSQCMRNLNELDRFRDRSDDVISLYGSIGDETCGRFFMESPIDRAPMCIIAASGEGWDHVSVSRKNRVPNWIEMEYVKRKFFHPDEVAFEFHVAEKDHISHHPNCLHLWRPLNQDIMLPPKWMVGAEEGQ